MSAPATRFNLRPQERRLIAFVAIVVFVVLNVWLVWPHFGDWSRVTLQQDRARKTLELYEREIARVAGYRVKLRELETAGSSVVAEEQDLDLVRTVNNQAIINRLTVIQSDPRPRVTAGTQTNRFFEEQYQNLHVTAGNEELVNFLVSLTATNSLIRVKDLSLKPDSSGTRLDGNMTLVASYQRTAPARPASSPTASAPTPAATPAVKPSAPAAGKTNKPAVTPPAGSVTNRVASPKTRPTTNPPASKR